MAGGDVFGEAVAVEDDGVGGAEVWGVGWGKAGYGFGCDAEIGLVEAVGEEGGAGGELVFVPAVAGGAVDDENVAWLGGEGGGEKEEGE